MNINNWSRRRKIFAFFIAIFIIVGLVITIFLVQRVQEIRSRAEKATVLSLSPPNQSVEKGERAPLEVKIDPGVNQVSFIKFIVKFDSNKLTLTKDDFSLNQSANLQIVQTPAQGNGELTVTLSVGPDPTKIIQSPTTLGVLNFLVKDVGGISGSTQITFDETKTQVRSIGEIDVFTENVLLSTIPATITIGGPVCSPNVGTCSWDPVDGATLYNYKITNVETGEVVQEGNIGASTANITFPTVPGKTYKCEVSAVNECGVGDQSDATSECPLPSATPTPTPLLTSTPTPSVTPEPTETPVPTEEVTPTEIVEASPTLEASPTEIAVVVTEAPPEGEGSPTPTLIPTGSPLVIGGIIGGILFILGGLALLLL